MRLNTKDVEIEKTYIDSNKHVRISGKTIVASDSITNLGVSIPILPQEIFSLGGAPEYPPNDVEDSEI